MNSELHYTVKNNVRQSYLWYASRYCHSYTAVMTTHVCIFRLRVVFSLLEHIAISLIGSFINHQLETSQQIKSRQLKAKGIYYNITEAKGLAQDLSSAFSPNL